MSATFRLVSRKEDGKFGDNGMDFSFDNEGRIEKLTGTNKAEQETLKILFCAPTEWGYGCGIAGLVGAKYDNQIVRGAVTNFVLGSLASLMGFQAYASSFETMDPSEIIYEITRVYVSESPDGYNLELGIITSDAQGFSTSEKILEV